MDLPLQPPPDAPAPPPGPEARRSRRIARWIFVTGGLLVVGFLTLAWIYLHNARSNANLANASGNLRSLHWGLMSFDADYGRFPDASTAGDVKTSTSATSPLGSSTSNELLRQLVATHVRVESVFYAPSSVCPRKPDNRVGADALTKGECAFAYVAGLSSAVRADTPILMAPVLPASKRFERRWDMDRSAVILLLDGSVQILPVDSRGEVILNGMSILDPRQPFWGGKAPDIKWPE
jgi:hypothetical protein